MPGAVRGRMVFPVTRTGVPLVNNAAAIRTYTSIIAKSVDVDESNVAVKLALQVNTICLQID